MTNDLNRFHKLSKNRLTKLIPQHKVK